MNPGYLVVTSVAKDRCPDCGSNLSPEYFDARYTASYVRHCLNEFCRFKRVERKI